MDNKADLPVPIWWKVPFHTMPIRSNQYIVIVQSKISNPMPVKLLRAELVKNQLLLKRLAESESSFNLKVKE